MAEAIEGKADPRGGLRQQRMAGESGNGVYFQEVWLQARGIDHAVDAREHATSERPMSGNTEPLDSFEQFRWKVEVK